MKSADGTGILGKFIVILGLAAMTSLAGADLNDGVDNYVLTFGTGGHSGWQQDTMYSAPGGDGDSARSGGINDNEFSFMETFLEGPGNLVFWWRADSEGCWPGDCDVLSFQMDGIRRGAFQGTGNPWREAKFWISPGTHYIRWEYSRNPSISAGLSAGWVDRVAFYPAIPVPMDIKWEYAAAMPAPARQFLAGANLYGWFYILGGWAGGLLPYLARYDEAGNFWETRADMTTSRERLAGTALDGQVFALGGIGGTGSLSIVESYDPVSNGWTNTPGMNDPRSEFVAVTANGRIYAIGGYDTAGPFIHSSLEEFDPIGATWTTRSAMSGPRAGMAAAVVNNMIYVIGGYNGGVVSTVEQYNPFNDTWILRASMPTPRKWLAAVAIDGKIYAIGGADNGDQPLSVVEEYDPIADVWKTKSGMPDARYGHAGTAVNGRIIVAGGYEYGALETVLRGTLVPESPQGRYLSIGGRIPDGGRIIVAPNRLDPLAPQPYVYFVAKGDPFGMTGFRVYNEMGALMIERSGVQLDQDGLAVAEFDGRDKRGRRLGTGLYWVLFDGGGVKDKQPFMVARKENR